MMEGQNEVLDIGDNFAWRRVLKRVGGGSGLHCFHLSDTV